MNHCLSLDEFTTDYPEMLRILSELHFGLLFTGFSVGIFVMMFSPQFIRSTYKFYRFLRFSFARLAS